MGKKVSVDRMLLKRAKKLAGKKSNEAVADAALKCLVNETLRQALKEMEGIRWYGDLDAMRSGHPSAMTVAGLLGQD